MHAFSFRFPAAALLVSLALAATYLGFVFAARYQGNFQTSRIPAATSAPKAIPPWLAPDPPGLRIQQFYASTGTLVRGEEATVCYGTANAVRVALHPPTRELSPARSRCFAVSPAKDTTYRLDAWDAAGNTTSEAFTIRVLPAPPRLLFLDISRDSIRRGDKPNICYGVVNATRVTLKPTMQSLPLREKYCAIIAPAVTTRFVLEAEGPGGRDRLAFTIRVQ